MRKRIFSSICLASFITLLLTSVFIIDVLYTNSSLDMQSAVKLETSYISRALNVGQPSQSYLQDVGRSSTNRITLILADGSVAYDSFRATAGMDNHLDRPEVAAAFESGSGEAIRRSETVGEKTYYYAVRLEDGSVLRIGNTSKSIFGLIRNAVAWVLIISFFILIISVITAHYLSNRILKPINALDLDHPLSNITYDELSPLLTKMDKQNKKIARQLDSLSEQQRDFEYITGSMNEGLIIFGSSGNVISLNDSARRIFDASDVSSYLTVSRNESYISAVESALGGESAAEKMKKDGRVYQLTASAVQGESEKYSAVMFVVDVTDHEQSEELRREFSANVSHELKTPLTSIMGYAEIIGNGIAKQEDIAHFANQINSDAKRLLLLIEDILRLSRLDEEELRDEFEYVELLDICKSVNSELSDKAKAAEISISFCGERAVIYGCKSVLYEMVFNLCDNAIKYNKPHGSVDISLEKKGGKTILTVSDSGIGIPPEHQGRVFERFYRVDKSRSKATGGTGLGLSIVKHGAMLHKAGLELRSEPDNGTTITITFDTDKQ